LAKKSGEKSENMNSDTRAKALMNLNIRTFQAGDYEKYSQYYRNNQEFHDEAGWLSPQSLEEVLFSPRCRPDKDVLVIIVGEEIIGLSYLIPEPEIDRVILRGIIHPRYRLKGIGLALLRLAANRAGELGISVIQSDVDEKNQSAKVFLEANGFRKVGVFHEMRLVLGEKNINYSLPEEKHIKKLKPGQEGLLTELQNFCFNGSWGYHPNNEDEVTYCLNLKKCSYDDVLMVYIKDKTAGFCWLTIDPEIPLNQNLKKGRIHMMGVVPNYRQGGLGRGLLIAGLSHLINKGINHVELTVDSRNKSAFELYRSVGFKVSSNTEWYEKALDHTQAT
jgi:mycothiol synthase